MIANTNAQPAHRTTQPHHLETLANMPGGPAAIEQILAATEERKINSVIEQARIGFKSKYLPKYITTEDQAIAIALAGSELGIPPMTAFRAIYFFDGRVVLSSALLVALAHKRVEGFRLDIVKSTEAGCWVEAMRPNMTMPAKFYFTLEDATRAGLTGKDNWKKYPAAMCIARASAMAVRAIAPEAGLGMLTQEEKDDGVRYEVDLTAEGLQVTPQQPPASPVDAFKEQLRQQQAPATQQATAPAAATPKTAAEKKAARAEPPAAFAGDDPNQPPPGFPTSKKKGKDEPARQQAAAPARQEPKEETKPKDPLDCSERQEGEEFEVKGQRFRAVRLGTMGLAAEPIAANSDGPPDDDEGREPGQD